MVYAISKKIHDVLFEEHYMIFFEKNLEFTGIVCIFAARNKKLIQLC